MISKSFALALLCLQMDPIFTLPGAHWCEWGSYMQSALIAFRHKFDNTFLPDKPQSKADQTAQVPLLQPGSTWKWEPPQLVDCN